MSHMVNGDEVLTSISTMMFVANGTPLDCRRRRVDAGTSGRKSNTEDRGVPSQPSGRRGGGGRSLRGSSSMMPRASPPPRSSTSPPKPLSQTSPYLWKGALSLQKPGCLVHRPSQKTHFPDQKQGGLRTAPTLPLRRTSYRYILAIRTRRGVTHARFTLMELPEP